MTTSPASASGSNGPSRNGASKQRNGPRSLADSVWQEEQENGNHDRILKAPRPHCASSNERDSDSEAEVDLSSKTDVQLAYMRWESTMKLRKVWEQIFARVSKKRKRASFEDGVTGIEYLADHTDGAMEDRQDEMEPSEGALLNLLTNWEPRRRILPPLQIELETEQPIKDDDGLDAQSDADNEGEDEDDDIIDFSKPDWEDFVRGKKRTETVAVKTQRSNDVDSLADLYSSDSTSACEDSDTDVSASSSLSRMFVDSQMKSSAMAQLMSLFPSVITAPSTPVSKAAIDQKGEVKKPGQQQKVVKTKASSTVSGEHQSPSLQDLQSPHIPFQNISTPQSTAPRFEPRGLSRGMVTPQSSRHHTQRASPMNPDKKASSNETPKQSRSSPSFRIAKSSSPVEAMRSPSVACLGPEQCTKSFCMACGAIGRTKSGNFHKTTL